MREGRDFPHLIHFLGDLFFSVSLLLSKGMKGSRGSHRPASPLGARAAAPGVEVRHEPQRGAGLQDTGLALLAAARVLADVVEDEGRGLVQGAEIQRVAVGRRDVHDHGQGAGLQAPPLRVHDLCVRETRAASVWSACCLQVLAGPGAGSPCY